MQQSEQHNQLEALVADKYGGDPTRVLTDLATRYGLAIAVLDRDWFTQAAGRDLTEIEWKRLAAEFGDFNNAVRESCADQLSDYASTMLGTAGIGAQAATGPELPPPLAAEGATHSRSDASVSGPEEQPKEPMQNGRGHAQLALAAEPAQPREMPGEQASADLGGEPLSLAGINRMVPHSARVWDYLLGGHDNYEIDRQAADAFHEVYPRIVELMAAQRVFGRRAVEYLIEQGVRQFIDIGPGLPSSNCRTTSTDTRATDSHVVARTASPDARVVYVDNDPLVLTHAQALLNGEPGGLVGHLSADISDTGTVLAGAAEHLDLDQPVAVLLIGVMGHIGDDDDAHAIVRRLMAGLAPGSFLALSDATTTSTALTWAQETYNATGATPYRLRTPTRIAEFFSGMNPLQPGLVPPTLWRPRSALSHPGDTDARCAVAKTT
ncbi:SAM-dependent methyltransferase [Actinomadura welshii]|uniref:SAM-dependent methyltransferase n=1 Tax=Actinomadura welshii TaxID=3103817 RepID=UPI003B8A847D